MSKVTQDDGKGRPPKGKLDPEVAKCECGSGGSECGGCGGLSCKTRIHLECSVRADTASWRAPAFSSYAYLRDELKRLGSMPNTDRDIVASVERALDEALLAMTPPRQLPCERRYQPVRRRLWIWLTRFYSASDIEQTWRAVHRAQAALYVIYPQSELVPQAEHVEAVIAELPEQSSLLKLVTNLVFQLEHSSKSVAEPGIVLRGIYERAIDISDHLQVEARALRNALITASVPILLVLVAVGVAHLIDRDIVDLCSSTGKHKACPLGGSSHPFDVFAVELVGMLGGLLSIVIPLATGERIKTPYRVFNQQLVLKTLAGAATAVGGVLLVGGGVIDTIKLNSTTAVLGYAAVFGFAQQIVTGAIDRRVDSLAKDTPTAKS